MALELARGGATALEISVHYGVSESLGTWRVAHTGIYQQLERTRRWYSQFVNTNAFSLGANLLGPY